MKLDGKAFNAYLKDEGLDHVLAAPYRAGASAGGIAGALLEVREKRSCRWETHEAM